MHTSEESQISYEILAYLAEHRHSSDTLRGIVEWWLLERDIKYQIAEVEKALSELVARGMVLTYTGRDLRTHYRINQARYEEIQAFFKHREG